MVAVGDHQSSDWSGFSVLLYEAMKDLHCADWFSGTQGGDGEGGDGSEERGRGKRREDGGG